MVQKRKTKKNRRMSPKRKRDTRKVFIAAASIAAGCVFLLFAAALFGTAGTLYDAAPAAELTQAEPGQLPYPEQAAKATDTKPPADTMVPADAQVSATKKATPALPQNSAQTSKLAGSLPQAEQAVAKRTKKSASKQKKESKYKVPAALENARLAFVIDDAGQDVERLRSYTSLPFPLAIAVMPCLAETKDCAALVIASGKELMLHQPMQAKNLNLWAGPGSITPDMELSEVRRTVEKNLNELGRGVRGLNNHEGSLITEDEVRIGAVLDVASDYGVFFLDSRTTSLTKAPQAASVRGMSILSRDVFIDNVTDNAAMLRQIYEGLSIANKTGKAIMIGHVDKSVTILPELLAELYPYLVEAGYRFVTPSQLLGN